MRFPRTTLIHRSRRHHSDRDRLLEQRPKADRRPIQALQRRRVPAGTDGCRAVRARLRGQAPSPGVCAPATIDHLSGGRLNVGLGAGWMPEEFAASSATHIFPRRHAHVRETIEICQGIWTNETFEYHGEFADFDPCGFGHQPVQKPHPPIYFSGLRDPKRSANRVAKYGLAGWIGIQDTPRELTEWRTAITRELEELGKSIDDLDMCSMIWFTITDEEVDQSDNGKVSNILVGTAGQITDMLKRYKEAGLTMPLLWPPFADVPVSKTLDDLKRLKEEIMPKVEAA